MKISTAAKGVPTSFKLKVDGVLDSLLTRSIKDAGDIDPLYSELLTLTKQQVVRSGKRLRPFLTYTSYLGYAQEDSPAILQASASQEFFHNFLLIHDDVIDRDLIRHAAPNIISRYIDILSDRGLDFSEASHYASSYAILAGNALSAIGLETILTSDFPDDRKQQAAIAVQRMLFEEMGGQLTDISVAIPDSPDPGLDQLLRICRYKTASYTFETPLKVGALLAGAGPVELEHLIEYARAIGVVFQLADDLLGVYGSDEALGKPVLSDITEGKHTVLIHYAISLGNPAQKKNLNKLWGDRDAGDDELDIVRDLLEETGAKSKTEQLAQGYIKEALEGLSKTKLSQSAKDTLAEIAEFSIKRTS